LHAVFTYPLFSGPGYAMVSCKFLPWRPLLSWQWQNWLQAHKSVKRWNAAAKLYSVAMGQIPHSTERISSFPPKNFSLRSFFWKLGESNMIIIVILHFWYIAHICSISEMQNDNIKLPPNFSKTFPRVTVLNLKGSNSCLDLVGSQHHDIFCNQLQVIIISEVIKQFTCDQLLLVARVSDCQKNSIVCQTVSNTPVSVTLMSATDLNDDVNSVVFWWHFVWTNHYWCYNYSLTMYGCLWRSWHSYKLFRPISMTTAWPVVV